MGSEGSNKLLLALPAPSNGGDDSGGSISPITPSPTLGSSLYFVNRNHQSFSMVDKSMNRSALRKMHASSSSFYLLELANELYLQMTAK